MTEKNDKQQMQECWQKIVNCELKSFCASQLSTIVLLVITMIVITCQIYQSNTSSEVRRVLSVQYGIVLISTTLFYLLGAWKIGLPT